MRFGKTITAAGITVGVVALSAGSATAGALITSADIKDQTIQSRDIGANGVGASEVQPETVGWENELNQHTRDHITNLAGRVTGLEADGPYPGSTELQEGNNSDEKWTTGGLQQSWVECPPGKRAVGGGFTLAADASDADKRATQVTGSNPTQIDGDEIVYHQIPGDPDGSYVPDGWLVEGYYTGADPNGVTVRPWVTCVN